MPVNSARSCGGRGPSSTWPPATPPRAPASVWDRRWRWRWHGAALRDGGWGAPGGARTSTKPSRWPDAATTRQPSPLSSPGPTVSRCISGCSGPMTPLCASSRRRCRPPRRRATMSHCCVAEYGLAGALLSRDAEADRHRGLELMVQARDLSAAQADWSSSGPGPRVVGRPGEGKARRPRCCHCGDAPSRGRAAPGRTARYGVWGTGVLVETLLERGAEGDLAEAQEAIDRLANLPADRRFGDARNHAAAAARAASQGSR